MKRALATFAALALAACAAVPRLGQYTGGGSVELSSVPFFAQDELQCGPAALATVLDATGAGVTPADLKPQVYIPARGGSLQAELIAATRVYGRVPYVLQPTLDALLAELRAGHPVLILQNLGLDALPTWHYAVLIGYDTASDQLILRSGREPRQQLSLSEFLAFWRGDARWAMVVTTPDRIPATATPEPWIAAAAAFESLHKPALAETAYAAATQRWPQASMAWLALGNARYALGDKSAAAQAYAQAVKLAPTSADALNNYGQALADLGCPASGRAQAQAALALAADESRRQVYRATLAGIGTGNDGPACKPL